MRKDKVTIKLIRMLEDNDYCSLDHGGGSIRVDDVFNMLELSEKHGKNAIVFFNFRFNPDHWIEKYKKVRK